MAHHSPVYRTVVLTDANTNYVLSTLLAGLTSPPDLGTPPRAAVVQLQVDIDAGAAEVRIGNPSLLSDTDFGVVLVATQAHTIGPFESNLILLDHIVLRSDLAAIKVGVALVVR